MAERLLAIKTVMKPTASLYLHCDPYASHYLKLLTDRILGKQNFRNEIVWGYGLGGSSKRYWSKKHDIILYYSKTGSYYFDKPRMPATSQMMSGQMKGMLDYWTDIPTINNMAKERLGYPTQKPLALLHRIINASSDLDGLILDPFCGCGTTVHAAEELDRNWIGIDISHFSTGLMRERILSNFPAKIAPSEITMLGLPATVYDARELARYDYYEFEKWACGKIGCNGLGMRKGPDGGIDGIMELGVIRNGKEARETAIVQVKSGHVSADSVRALSEVVRRSGSVAGIMLCFADQMVTVENQRSQEVWSDVSGTYPVIQGFSVEDLLAGKRPILPPRYGIRRGGRLSA